MRDPRAPIPHPQLERDYWRTVRPPRPVADPASGRPHEIAYDPTQLIAEAGDPLGIDRRTTPRCDDTDALELESPESCEGVEDASMRTACVLAGAHKRFDAILGLRTAAGWALVRTISFSPNGVLVRVLDPCDPGLDVPLRVRARAALARLGPGFADVDDADPNPIVHGSMLATVGACLLSERVVADLSRWTHRPRGRRAASSTAAPRRHLRVELVVPPPTPRGGRVHMSVDPPLGPEAPTRASAPRFEGRLVPLNDPSELVLAVAMRAEHLFALENILRGPRRRCDEARGTSDGVLAP